MILSLIPSIILQFYELCSLHAPGRCEIVKVPDKIIIVIQHDDKSSKVFRAIFMCIFNKLVTRGTQNKLN